MAKQRGQGLHLDNIQEVLDASPDAIKKGQQQFETPLEIAEALCIPLTPFRPTVADFNCGHGNLLRAARNSSTRELLGIDIDRNAQDKEFTTIIGDVNLVFPLLVEAEAKFDMIVLNPPFSLRWPQQEGEGTVDSTLRTWQMALDRLTNHGEGFMICNAHTAERLIVDDEHIWLRLDLPDFFSNIGQDMRIAVLYFSKNGRMDKGNPPLTIRLENAFPDAMRLALAPFRTRRDLRKTRPIENDWMADTGTVHKFGAVRGEWKRLKDEEAGKRVWNISLQDTGHIRRYLTPFEAITDRAPTDLIQELDSLAGKSPMELVVQRSTRAALQRACECGIWRVQPELIAAVRSAVAEYNSVRAPFVKLNEVQRLGYLDEAETIQCTVTFAGFIAGGTYHVTTETFKGVKIEQRKRLGKGPEDVEVVGQELLIKIGDALGNAHGFTQYPLEEDQIKEHILHKNHTLQTLVENFQVPEVLDVSETNPTLYQTFKDRLLALQH